MSQAPLASPSSAETSMSSVIGPLSGPAPSDVALNKAKSVPAWTIPFLIGRNSQRLGRSWYAESTDATRSDVLLRQSGCSAQSAA